ncbi:N-alpha-acetyl-L-2,4-diaminobutyric acid deacetylase [Smittium mucronatum]|uniref:N-alpha-acetyl-L-2,4-diaminobutyric acid deacetylase n=1 Tax=Smittium mucronatum TaxID=133383 RepID=A0A1R0H7F7_9FUNG|nr:N-alpha-acetyl-L-2,4-diaminobutyric acid deacetylase [Smittium mucronatum]
MRLAAVLSCIAPLFILPVCSQTVYTGDILSGHKVISRLDVDDLPYNSYTKLWLRMTLNQIGQSYHVPIIVAKGHCDGKRLLLSTGIHGDELNGIRVVQRVLKDIDTSTLQGVVVGIPQSNVNAMYAGRREFVSHFETGVLTNINRRFPGNSTARLAPDRYVSILWNNVHNVNNFDSVVDFHTQTSNYKFPNFVYADFRVPYVQTMAELTGADVIKIDDGSSALGSVEVVNDASGRPSITYELGSPLLWQKDQIQRAYDYTFRLMANLTMYPANSDSGVVSEFEAYRSKSFYGNAFDFTNINTGGFVERYVDLLDVVHKGQVVGAIFNVFGDKLKDLTNSVDGVVTSIGTSPLLSASDYIINTIYFSNDTKCQYGGC